MYSANRKINGMIVIALCSVLALQYATAASVSADSFNSYCLSCVNANFFYCSSDNTCHSTSNSTCKTGTFYSNKTGCPVSAPCKSFGSSGVVFPGFSNYSSGVNTATNGTANFSVPSGNPCFIQINNVKDQ